MPARFRSALNDTECGIIPDNTRSPAAASVGRNLSSSASNAGCKGRQACLLQGKIKEEVGLCVRGQTRQMNSEVQELNVQADHVHLIVQIPPKLSGLHGTTEGQERDPGVQRVSGFATAALLGQSFWAQGYCVGTVGLEEEMIRKYVKWQEKTEQRQETFRFGK